jgi:hypothetical protein
MIKTYQRVQEVEHCELYEGRKDDGEAEDDEHVQGSGVAHLRFAGK